MLGIFPKMSNYSSKLGFAMFGERYLAEFLRLSL